VERGLQREHRRVCQKADIRWRVQVLLLDRAGILGNQEVVAARGRPQRKQETQLPGVPPRVEAIHVSLHDSHRSHQYVRLMDAESRRSMGAAYASIRTKLRPP